MKKLGAMASAIMTMLMIYLCTPMAGATVSSAADGSVNIDRSVFNDTPWGAAEINARWQQRFYADSHCRGRFWQWASGTRTVKAHSSWLTRWQRIASYPLNYRLSTVLTRLKQRDTRVHSDPIAQGNGNGNGNMIGGL